jgi:hypothetical protein
MQLLIQTRTIIVYIVMYQLEISTLLHKDIKN